MKKFSIYAMLFASLSLSLASCDKGDDNGDNEPVDTSNLVKTGALTANETWTAERIVELDGKVIVPSGITLTIEAGTIIKGRSGAGSLASALVVAKGGKLMAEGTASAPIIFTSIDDNIKVGEVVGTNLEKTDNQLWGGVIILGNAPISAEAGDTETAIEGIPADEDYNLYGGNNANDNSGVLKYVSIRHGGTLIAEGNEINGLTLGGVGSGTVIENVEVYGNYDDGIEFFGGTVNAKNLLVYWQGDDGIDIDMNYSGTIDNFAVIHGEGVGTDKGLEIDGPEGATNVNGLFTLKNGLVQGDGIQGEAADLKSKAQGTIENTVFEGYADGKFIKMRASYDNNCADAKSDAFSYFTSANPKLIITGSSFSGTNLINVYTASKDANAADCPVQAADQTAAESTLTNAANATGATMTVFSWTAAAQRDEI
ncbi:right-handed parallel beta-helix repeat-containing protein [Cytophagales bacterium LB-30]|uniref:Right-handed parallel beta-helix repeat-containing protein n=1 Tax=Shiella aurantiaca TaxID=3058365 RepID=A0ABT8F622_9BACT|nr:right-handed parallel beta-helix repeat-containing protein [Shiella aurantiaca]MDN4165887.1 right-handed parallel beta-helix repeat-containing protein [Shiella aurantiaca]